MDFQQFSTWPAILEILILAAAIYTFITFLRGTRGAGILRGLGAVLAVIVIISFSVAKAWNLEVIKWLISNGVIYLLIALVVIFQPELRSALMRLGQSPVFTSFVKERWDASKQIAKAVMTMSKSRTGALIAIQRTVGLRTYTEGGIRVDGQVTAELLCTIFKKGSPLHDGAVVIKGDRLVAAACVFPLSENPNIDTSLGTRHRAGIGVTEESDAVAIIVSEESGAISVAQNGSLKKHIDEQELLQLLHAVTSEEGFQSTPTEAVS